MNTVKLDIKNKENLHTLIADYKRHKPTHVAFDTETDGLDISASMPFLIGFGFVTKDLKTIYSYTLDYELAPKQLQIDTIYVMRKMFETSVEILGHNITYDLHMQDNINYPLNYPDKYSDTQIYIRLAHDSKTLKEGGPPLDLKGYTARFVDPNARGFQQKLKDEIKQKRREATSKLKAKLHGVVVPDKYKVSGKEKNWTKAMIDTFFKDAINEIEDLPQDVQKIIKEWEAETPDTDNYRLLNRTNVTEYLHYDIIYTLLIWIKLRPIIVERKQEPTLERERKVLHAIYTLEKTGWIVDIDYLKQAKKQTKEYLIELRNKFKKLIKKDISAGQHEAIKNQFLDEFNIHFSSTDANTLDKALHHEAVGEEAKEVIKLIKHLRTLEKWYSTYIIRWLRTIESKQNNVIYPTYKTSETVTGRVSSPFQQFPRDPLTKLNGEELFHPRQMFIAPKGYKMFYLDYAAMEMRIQAIYTMLIDEGDLNLCRAYIPLKCHQRGGKWYLDEDPNTEWTPTDLHGLTTINAFDISLEHELFKHYRYLGKRANFAMIYGASAKTLKEQLHLDSKDAQNLYRAFYKSYPKVQNYVSYIDAHIREFGYAENLFQRKYYGVSTHNARNYLIQGSGADYTKTLLPQLIELLNGTKSKMLGYLHDEFSFLIHKDEEHLVPKLKTIMESLETEIKLAVDVEYSNTNWRNKIDWTND